MRLKSSYCCCSLRCGCILIGIISAAWSLAALVGAVAWACSGAQRSWAEGEEWAAWAKKVGMADADVRAAQKDIFSSLSLVSAHIRVLLHLLGVVEAFHFNFSLMLLYGIKKESCSLMQLWVRASAVVIAGRLLLQMPIIVRMFLEGYIVLGILGLSVLFAVLGFSAYSIFEVNNYRTELMSEKNRQSSLKRWYPSHYHVLD